MYVRDHPPTLVRAKRAFTLLEIGVVIGIIAVISALGIATMRGSMPRYRMVNASKQLKGDLMDLRMKAIEQNRQTRLVLEESDDDYLDPNSASAGAWKMEVGNRSRNSTRWRAVEDGSSSVNIAKAGNRPFPDVSLMPWGSFSGPGRNNSEAIVFSPRGWVENPAEDFQSSGYMVLTLVNKEARAKGINDFIEVRVSRAGLVDLEAALGRDPDGGTVGVGGATTSGAFLSGGAR